MAKEEMMRVNDFRKLLLEYGFDFSESKLRYYTELGLIPHERNEAEQRLFSKDSLHKAVRNILLYELGVSPENITSENKEVIQSKLKSIEEILQKFF